MSILAPQNDEEGKGEDQDEAKKNGEDGDEEEGDGKKEPDPVAIDLEGFESRLVVLPAAAGNYRDLRAVEGKVLYRRLPRTGATDDPFGASLDTLRKGAIVTCTVHQVTDGGIEVLAGGEGGSIGFIRKAELSRDRSEQRPDRFAVGEKLDAKITTIDKKNRKISLSIKALEIAEEKEAVRQYGSTDSGASLGDILGAALSKAQNDAGDEE